MTINQNQAGAVNGFGGLVIGSPITSPALKARGAALGQGPKGIPDTPSTQCSTAPNTPALMGCFPTMPNAFSLDDDQDDDYCSDFAETPVMRVSRCRLSSVDEKAASADENDVQEETLELAPKEEWTVRRGAPPSLEQSLNEVKAVYHATFEQDVDAPLQEVAQKDDVKWIVHRGALPSISELEQSLGDVKASYTDKFGEDVDEEVIQKDDVTWIVHRCAPPSMSALEQSLADVKASYTDKFGEDVDEEVIQKDGVEWIVHRGAPPSISALEQSLADVKASYTDKFGEDVDEEVIQKDGVEWIVRRGAPPSMSALEQMLDEVKDLYKRRFGLGESPA